MSRPVVEIKNLAAIKENSPESLPVIRVIVYDKEGIPSKIRAVELDRFLSLGFTADPPPAVNGYVEPPAPFVPPPTHRMVRSFRS